MFTLQWRCFIDNLTGLLFSREKVIATQLLNYDRNWKLLNIQKRELTSPICKTLRVHGVHRNVTQYSPVLQRFSAKTNELSLALNFSYSVVSMPLDNPRNHVGWYGRVRFLLFLRPILDSCIPSSAFKTVWSLFY